jgi:hypothetical protein
MVEETKAFEAYPADRFIEIVKAWANHPWPITSDEGRVIYESLGLRGYAPRPNFFWSDFSTDDEPDSYYVVTQDEVSTIDMEVARLAPSDKDISDDSTLHSTYTQYCTVIDSTFGTSETKYPVHDKAVEWVLHNDVRIRIANIDIAISLVIHSPHMAQLRREEEEMGLTSYDEILEDD